MKGALEMFSSKNPPRYWLLLLLPAVLPLTALYATDGHVLHGVGPINQSMGGAGTGVCVDPIGSVAWNPACTARFAGTRLELSFEWFSPKRSVSSTVNEGAFGPGFPQATLSGTTESDGNSALLPTLTFTRRSEGGSNAFSFGMIGIGGFGVEYEQSDDFSNPILTPQPPNGLGLGRIESNYVLMKIPVGYSRLVTDDLSIGVAVLPAMSKLRVTPAPFAPPVMTPDSPMPYYLGADTGATAWGVGFEAGLQYNVSRVFSVGGAYHSPIWFSDFEWQSPDHTGTLHPVSFRLDGPQLVSFGFGLTPAETTTIAVDFRHIDYSNTEGFEKSGFNPDGSVAGFGWDSIWAFAAGVQQQVARGTWIRGGYNYGQNPIPDELSFVNAPAPGIVQHHLSLGFTQQLTPNLGLSFAYYRAFENSQTGSWLSPMGPVPGTSVTSSLSENSVAIGLSGRF